MKKFRRMLKLIPPAFVMRFWLKWRYGINVPPAPGNAITKFALAVLPYAFTAALSVRVESDCRLLKYFLPYGKMKKFVRLMYNMQVGNDEKDCGFSGRFRSVMPYGLVLWWDAEDRRFSQKAAAKPKPKAKAPQPQPSQEFRLDFGWRIPERERLEFQCMDKIEAVTLRLLIISGGEG